ncbi:MAG: hypothetical protein IPJ39_00535 [Saprospiraceae bacterium]|nr:hypothetical protein [Saprospiraceae bacterium]
MKNFINNLKASAPIGCICLLCMILLLSACEKPMPPEPEVTKDLYNWQVKLPWTQEHPHFSDGYYYLFPIFKNSRHLNFTKINEKTGEVIFDKTIFTDIDVYAFNPMLFEENGRLVYLHGKYIFQLDKNSGNVFAVDTFSNYINHTVRQDGYFTGASYTDSFATYKFFEIVYEGGHYREKLIHTEPNKYLGDWEGGSAPIKINGKWVLEYSIFDFDKTHMNSWIIIKDGENTIKQDLLPGYTCSFELFDDENIYLTCSDDRFICLDKSDFKVKWNIPTISGAEYTLYKDKILCYNRDVRKRFNTIDKNTGQITPFTDFIL